MSILLGCDSFLSLRNVRNGDLGRRLAALTGEEVIVLVDPAQYEGSLAARPPGVKLDRLLEANVPEDSRLGRLLQDAYETRKWTFDPRSRWSDAVASCYAGKGRWRWGRMAKMAVTLLRAVRYRVEGQLGLGERRRYAVARQLRRHPIIDRYMEVFKAKKVALVVGFSLEGPREKFLLEAANAANIPTAVMIRSRDNLAAKIKHLPDAHAYLVWSEWLRKYFLHMYPEIPASRVHVTGSPQFDHHLDERFRLPREEFFARVGLDPARPLIVYSTATPLLIPHEIDIVQYIADAVSRGEVRRNGVPAQLLVRPHPRGFGSDYPLLHSLPPGVAIYPPPGFAPFRSLEHERRVVSLILDDEPVHLATLAYQDVQVNVAGTMSVDSAILNKPVVNVFFDLPPSTPQGLSVRRFYLRSDVRLLVKSGGVRLARSPAECLELLNRYLDEPHLDEEGRRWIRDNDCGPLDGRAGERVAAVLAATIEAHATSKLVARAGHANAG